jgi:hypothetical protein
MPRHFLTQPAGVVVDIGYRVDAVRHLDLAQPDPGHLSLGQHTVANGLEFGPAARFPDTLIELAQAEAAFAPMS